MVYVEELRKWVSVHEAVVHAMQSALPTVVNPSPIARQLAVIANAACTGVSRVAGSAGVLEQFGIDPATVTVEVVQEAWRLFNRMEPRLEPDVKWLKRVASKGELDEAVGDVPSPLPCKDGEGTRKVTRAKLFGYSITAVIRWMGANGWTFEDAAVVCASCGAAGIADVTIRLQLKAGKDGLRGPAAPITPSQAKQLRKMSK